MIQKLKNWFLKKDFDPERDSMDFRDYHAVLYFFLKYNYLVPSSEASKLSIASIGYVMLSGLAACCLISVSLVHSAQLRDLGQLTQAGTYVFMMVLWVSWPCFNYRDRRHYLALQRMMQDDFDYVCREGGKYRVNFLELQLLMWKASVGCVAFIFSIAVVMWSVASLSLGLYGARHEPGDGMRRQHIFPFWLPHVDVADTPHYEMLFVASYFWIFGFGYVFTMFLVLMVVWLGHILAKAEMVAAGVRGLLAGVREPQGEDELRAVRALLRARMREIVNQHYLMYSLMDHFSCVFGKYLMYQQLATVPVVCLTAYGFAEGLDQGEPDVIMLVLCVGSSIQAFIPSYVCTVIAIKFSSVIDECGMVEWWSAGRAAQYVRVDLQLLMMRALRLPRLRSAGFKEISLATFSGMMTSAYSYFNMLRQMK